jgi:endoglucanase
VRRGVNLGDALDSRSGSPGLVVSQDVIADVVAAGFDTVRVPVRWSTHAGDTAPWTITPGFADAVADAVEPALGAGLNVVLNVHHYDEINRDPAGHTDRLVALWRQIADRYQGHPDVLRFELLNEPRGALDPARWNQLLRAALAGVRSVDPERQVLIGPARANAVAGLPGLELPNDDHLGVTVHYYEPMRFTHQGASWEPGAARRLGTRWRPATDAQQVTRDLE